MVNSEQVKDMLNPTKTHDFEDLIELYRPSEYNGTTDVDAFSFDGESVLLSVETAAMAAAVRIHEPIEEDQAVRKHVSDSLEISLRDHSEVWDELSKH